MQEKGMMCSRCRAFLNEALCVRCATSPQTRRRVYISFFKRNGWVVNFLEADLKTLIGRIRVFRSEEQIREIAKRGNGLKELDDHHAFDAALAHGRGGLYLDLTGEQYAKLKRS